MAGQLRGLEDRLARIELALFPAPDFDDGWTALDAHSGIEWHADEDRPLSRVDILLKTGPDEFEPVPFSPREGSVWARPYPRDAPPDGVRSYLIYNRSDEGRLVRVQGWYADLPYAHQ